MVRWLGDNQAVGLVIVVNLSHVPRCSIGLVDLRSLQPIWAREVFLRAKSSVAYTPQRPQWRLRGHLMHKSQQVVEAQLLARRLARLMASNRIS